MKKFYLVLCMLVVTLIINAQNDIIIPVQVKEKFSDFSLTDHKGEVFTLSEFIGKKVMLVFIRGKVTEEIWCPICHYQYLELLEVDNKYKLRSKHNMEIVFVLPYKKDSLENWLKAFPESLKIVNGWKNPVNETEGALAWKEYCHKFFPYDFKYDESKFKLEFPVLLDEDQKLSKGLFLYKEEWGGTKVAQNIPTVFIIDEKGNVGFKYHSQYTNDRPDAMYLKEYLEKMF